VLTAASKVPFYVAGGALAGWAVFVAAYGVMRPGFPGSATAARLVMLASALLVGATVTAAVATGGGQGAHAAAANALDLTADPGGRTAYDTQEATVLAGTREIRLTNDSPVAHNITVAAGSRIVARTPTVTKRNTATTARLAPGTYVFYCSVDAHRAGGMQGTLTVR
jgi:plastocyanin